MANIELSIVIPCYNEEGNIDTLFSTFQALASKLPPFEILFVDDGSKDTTCDKIRSYKSKANLGFNVRLVRLSRNFGHQLALMAGMRAASGAACVTIDADLQDPPELIVEMVKKWKEGNDIVLGQRNDRSTDSLFKRLTATMFYKAMSYLTRGEFPAHVADFRLVSRKVLDVLIQLKENGPYWRGLVVWVGFKRAIVTYKRAERVAGQSNYPFLKMFALSMDAIFSFSKKPLYIALYVGFSVSIISLLIAGTYVVLKLAGDVQLVPGWMSVMAVVTLLGGLQLICLGIIGQYVGRIYEQVLQRPLVLNHEIENVQISI